MEQQILALNRQLADLIRQGVCVAFSAGVDSTVLLNACCQTAKVENIPLERIAAVTFATVLHPQADLEEAKQIAAQLGIYHEVLRVDELTNPDVIANGVERCYHCKKHRLCRPPRLPVACRRNPCSCPDGHSTRHPGQPGAGGDQSAGRQRIYQGAGAPAGSPDGPFLRLKAGNALPCYPFALWNSPADAGTAAHRGGGRGVAPRRFCGLPSAGTWGAGPY